jgi:hypothetical protein
MQPGDLLVAGIGRLPAGRLGQRLQRTSVALLAPLRKQRGVQASRRSSAPLPALSSRSSSARICALYFAEYRRGPRARSGTSGSGSVMSFKAPVWSGAFKEGSLVTVTGELLPALSAQRFSSSICLTGG